MPKGVPAAGFRVRNRGDGVINFSQFPKPKIVVNSEPLYQETDEEILARLDNAFDVLALMSQAVCDGKTKSLIVSGAPGLGKSFTVEKIVEAHGSSRVGYCKGYTRATGVYKLFHEYQNPGNVSVFDDCDAVFGDETSLNLLKAACDTLDKRQLNWGSETNMEDNDGIKLPRRFEYNGAVIFITNLDFEAMVASGNKLSPHLEALMSRSHYINLGMKTKREKMLRIKQVVNIGLLTRNGVAEEDQDKLMNYVDENVDKFRELSLRMMMKLTELFNAYPEQWQKVAQTTLFRGKL